MRTIASSIGIVLLSLSLSAPSFGQDTKQENSLSGVPADCEREGEKLFHKLYPKPGVGANNMPGYFRSAIDAWGQIPQSFAKEFVIRSIDDPFVNARTERIQNCDNGDRFLIVVGTRLHLAMWRIVMLTSDFWTMSPDGALEAQTPPGTWPSETVLNDLTDGIRIYFGTRELSQADFSTFNRIVFSSDKFASLMSSDIVDMAELFVFFHETQHVTPGPFTTKISLSVPPGVVLAVNRRKNWTEEIQADFGAMRILWIAACDTIHRRFPELDTTKANSIAAILVASGVDAALSTATFLERIKLGEIPIEKAFISPAFKEHPPSQLREDLVSRLVKQELIQQLGEQRWTEIQNDVAALRIPRTELMKAFLNRRSDVISELRKVP